MNNINEEIKSAIIDGRPVSFGKLGSVEADWLAAWARRGNPYYGQLFVNAGVYYGDRPDEWGEAFIQAMQNLDYALTWMPNKTDDWCWDQYKPDVKRFDSFEGLEPFVFGKDGWHYSLANKKVLCVSPFSETVQHQSKNFGSIWKGAEIGEVVTVTSPHSDALTGSRPPKIWQDKYRDMTDQIDELDFDFATVGCGGLSLLICNYIKNMGKPCVHLGGGNQILYGIRGRRWDDGFKDYDWYGTEYWVRPTGSEVPLNYKAVEGGCYW